MLQKLQAAVQVPDIRQRLQYVLIIFAVYICALHVPAAGINHDAMDRLLQSGLLNALDVFSGGALKKFSIIGLSITPYINASIFMQLMTVAIPQLKALQKEGESGRFRKSGAGSGRRPDQIVTTLERATSRSAPRYSDSIGSSSTMDFTVAPKPLKPVRMAQP